jgi:hypothetical protein
MKMPSVKRTILLIGVPAMLVGTGLTTMAASSPAPTTSPSQQSQAAPSGTTAEPADTAAEKAAEAAEPTTAAETAAEAAEAALPGGGHADDPSNANADNQFDGVQ